MDYTSKLISVEEALNLVKSGDNIVTGACASEPIAFLKGLPSIADKVENVTITNCLPLYDGEYLSDPKCVKAFNIECWFFTGAVRKAFANGNVSHIPGYLRLYGNRRKNIVPADVFVCQSSMPDEDGNISLGLSNIYEMEFVETAKTVIVEMNKQMPYVNGDHVININEVDHVVEVDYPLIEMADAITNEKDEKIGKFIAELVNDGDCVQVGIGGIPNAVCNCLEEKKELGIHTEMMTTGLMRMIEAGAVSNTKKQIDKRKTVCTFVGGTKELYDFVANNPAVYILNGYQTNDPAYIGKNDNQVSINTCIEIDLTGQCCSENIGTRHFSGTGGQWDTAVGAQNSKNGRSFITLYSTTTVKDKATGERKEISKIVPTLKPGAAVTLSRNDVDYVVTEYGVARLRGKSVSERAKALIEIAHPKFKDQLYKDAVKVGFIIEK